MARALAHLVVMGSLAIALSLASWGCGGSSPSTQDKLSQAQATHEYPSPKPPPTRRAPPSAPADATAAIRAFATQYINWNAATVAQQMRTLAAESVGQASSAMQLAAAQTAGDYELQRGGISNSGTVEAIARLAGHHNEYVVVTREATAATNSTAYQGLRPAWHLAIATVEEIAGKWVVSGWQPEN